MIHRLLSRAARQAQVLAAWFDLQALREMVRRWTIS